MTLRVVRLIINLELRDEFLSLIDEMKSVVRKREGCQSLKILESAEDEQVYYTISIWLREQDLEDYRRSEAFTSFWTAVKKTFSEKAKAISIPILNKEIIHGVTNLF